jgi:hypothetical protein
MTSVVDIYNMALNNIGHSQQVAATDEQSKAARVCSQWYEHCRDEMLKATEWPFATAWKALSQLTNVPTDDWALAYDYPSDALKARFIVLGHRRVHPYDRVPFEIASQESSGRKMILCDYEAITLCYTRRVTDPEKFPPLFTGALAAYLAYRIAMPMTANPEMRNAAYELYVLEARRAIAAELDEGQEDEPAEGEFVSERLS